MNLPKVKVKEIDLKVTSASALITNIGDFNFIYEDGSDYVYVLIGERETCDLIDVIEVDYLPFPPYMTVSELERVGLNWIFRHVEIVK